MTASKDRRQINIKAFPEDLHEWLGTRAFETKRHQNELVIEAVQRLRREMEEGETQMGLPFDSPPPDAGRPPRFGFRFVDLFAGVGGFRLALERLGGDCAFSSEWDKHAQRTYAHWYGDAPHGDINEIDPEDIPDHDILAAGFPCQPFSIAGVSKKNALGRPHGFDCDRQGNLFFKICDLVKVKRPPVLILENVKNLKSHDKRRTWQVIKTTLENELDYEVHDRIIDAADYVPQHRERIFIVCFDRGVFGRDGSGFEFPATPSMPRPRFRDILDPDVPEKYTLTDHLWEYLQAYKEKHSKQGNGFGFGLVDPKGDPDLVTRTLSARYYKDGSEILIHQGRGKNPRRLSPLECARLMGYGDKVRSAEDIVVSDTQAYKQFGNSVVPAVVEAVAAQALAAIDARRRRAGRNQCALKGRIRVTS